MPSENGAAPAAGKRTDLLDRVLGLMTAVPLFVIVLLTFVDVFARYLFSSPVRGSLEIIQFAMALVIFNALPVVTRHREHVTVSLIDGLVKSALMQRVKQALCDGVSLIAIGLLSWRLWVQAVEAGASDTRTIVLAWPMAPLTYIMCGFSVITALVILLHLWQAVSGKNTLPEQHA